MVTVCAWCERFLGLKDPKGSVEITHGICAACAARQDLAESATLVISRRRADTVPIFEELLKSIPEIRVVVDRRFNERRCERPMIDVPGGRRMRRDRRQNPSLFVA
jgi:hypothetical protein